MENLVKTHRITWRWVALVVVAIVATAALITPTVGNAALFLKKQKAHKLFLGNTSIVSNSATLAPSTGQALTVLCPPGFQAVDGGFNADVAVSMGTVEGALRLEEFPVLAGARSVGWTLEAFNQDSSNNRQVTVHAVCSN